MGNRQRARRWQGFFLVMAICFLMVCVALPAYAAAAKYPAKRVTVIVPWSPGGRTDLTARVIMPTFEKYLGQTAVIINKPGGAGVIGAKEVARAKPDGYTLGFFSIGFWTTQYSQVTPTDLKEYELICQVNFDPAAIAVNVNSPWRDLKELVGYAEKNPGKVRNGIAGIGSGSHIFAGSFAKAAGVEIANIPHKGDAGASVALAGGHLETQLAVPSSFRALVEAKKIRVLGIAAEERNPLYPEYPTFREQGIDYVMGSWHGLFAPKGTPKEIVEFLDKSMAKALKDPELIERANKALVGIVYRDREAFTEYSDKMDAMLRTLIKELGLWRAPRK